MSAGKNDQQNHLSAGGHEDDDEQELNEEEIVQVIIQLGNDILRNLGVEDPIDDVAVFFSDEFYIQFFQAAFPEIDFSQLTAGQNVEEMADNIQALIDLLGEQILKYDLGHIRGEEIVNGNPEHCINLLQLVQEISVMIQGKAAAGDVPPPPDEEDEVSQKESPIEGGAPGPQEMQYVDDLEDDIHGEGDEHFEEDFHGHNPDDEDDDLEQQFMQQLQNQPEISKKPETHEDEDDEPVDEDELKMYEQFLANNKQQEQQLVMKESEGAADEDEEIDLDDIDFEQLDPQILQLAEQMGVHPKEVLKQIMKMNNGEMEDEGEEDEEGEDGEDPYGDEHDHGPHDSNAGLPFVDDSRVREEQLRREKELFKAQMMGGVAPPAAALSSDKKKQSKVHPQQQEQLQQQFYQQQQLMDEDDDDDYGQDEDDGSYYSENEMRTRVKLINQKSYSAPYIIISDCYPEPLCDDDDNEDEQLPSRAYSTTVLQSLEQQEQQLMMQQQQQQNSQETANILQHHQQKMLQHQHHEDEEEEDEMDVDISQKLQELQQKQQHQNNSGKPSSSNKQDQRKQQQADEDEEDEEDDEEMMIDLDQLDDHNREMLLEYLKQEYDKNPGQFPFPKELIEDFMLKEQQNKIKKQLEGGSSEDQRVKDINSQEMILEDVGAAGESEQQIMGGGQEIEGDELHEDDDEGAEYLDGHHGQGLQVEYRGGPQDGIIDLKQQQHYLMQQQQQMMMQQQQQQQMPKRKAAKGTKKTKGSKSRPKSGKKPAYDQQVYDEQNQQEQQMIPEDQLQQLLQLLQEQQVDLDNLDPNFLQQILIAQQQQQQQHQAPPPVLAAQSQPRSTRATRPQTAGRKSSKKRNSKNTRTLQPYTQGQLAPAKAKLPQAFPGIGLTGSNKKKLVPAAGVSKKKKRPISAQVKQQKLFQQQMAQRFAELTPEQQMMIMQQQQQEQEQQVIQEEEEEQQQQQLQQQDEQEDQQEYGQEDMEPEHEEAQQPAQQQQQNLVYQQLQEIPNFSEEYLNQLSEEQLEMLLHQQQQLMLMQQQQQQLQSIPQTRSVKKSTSRPKSAKVSAPVKSLRPQSGKTPASGLGYQPYIAKSQKKLAQAKVQTKKNKKSKKPVAGVLMNNFFPALEGGVPPEYQKDPRYPKFGVKNLTAAGNQAQGGNNPNMVVQDQIDEVPQEQEEAESQENIQTTHGLTNFYQVPPANLSAVSASGSKPNQEDDEAHNINGEDEDQDQADPSEQQLQQDQDAAEGGEPTMAGVELTDEQLIELIQNAHALSPDQQQQLQLILQQRMKQEMVQDRAQSYQTIYEILMDNVRRAKERLAPLGQVSLSHHQQETTEETDRRILRQKQEFETLYRQYQNEMKAREMKKKDEDVQIEKRLQRESRIQAIRERKFQEELLSHQKSLNYKRNAQQVMLCQKVYKLASDLEKNKLLQEKREFKENQERKKVQNKLMVDAIETYYKNQVQLLKERIESERFERRVAQQAQQQALTRMKRELNDQKKQEVQRYLQLLKQEDSRYEFESSNIGKIEHEMVKMYKMKGK